MMATLTIEIPNGMLSFIDREVASGHYSDRGDFVRELLVLAMYDREHEPDCYLKDGKITFASEEQRERLEKKLEEALDDLDRGNVTRWTRGDCARIGREYLEAKHKPERPHNRI
jgi:Arc/MetJ-type ribon-helix-helix transcriptional regulator